MACTLTGLQLQAHGAAAHGSLSQRPGISHLHLHHARQLPAVYYQGSEVSWHAWHAKEMMIGTHNYVIPIFIAACKHATWSSQPPSTCQHTAVWTGAGVQPQQ